nr:transposase [Paenibacillus assamensis]
MSWAPFHGERAGIKLHAAYRASNGQLWNVVKTTASNHDGPVGEQLADIAFILVQDRAYGKIERIDHYLLEVQPFVIRLKDNIHLHNSRTFLTETRHREFPDHT